MSVYFFNLEQDILNFFLSYPIIDKNKKAIASNNKITQKPTIKTSKTFF